MSEVLHVCLDDLISVSGQQQASGLPLATANLVCMTDNRCVHCSQSRIQISSSKRQLTLFPSLLSLRVFISTGVYILIAAGALMMVVGFLGCCGAIKESPCMLGLVRGFRGWKALGYNRRDAWSQCIKVSLLFIIIIIIFQFFLFLLLIFAVEVAAGIWGLSNQEKVQKAAPFFCVFSNPISSIDSCVCVAGDQ